MNTPHVRVHYLREQAALYGQGLAYATPCSAGLDLRACLPLDQTSLSIAPGARAAVPTGIAIEIVAPQPEGWHLAGFVYARSGLGAVQGLTVAQGTGLIDPDYRGEITVFLLNTSAETRVVQRGDRIAQLVFQPVARLDVVALAHGEALGSTERGAGGFGHTGAS